MFNFNSKNQLEQMKSNHELKMQKLRLQGEMYIEENKIKNDIALSKPSIRKPPKFLADKFYAISLIILEIISSMSIGCLLLQNV